MRGGPDEKGRSVPLMVREDLSRRSNEADRSLCCSPLEGSAPLEDHRPIFERAPRIGIGQGPQSIPVLDDDPISQPGGGWQSMTQHEVEAKFGTDPQQKITEKVGMGS